ncbi:DUF4342 domain-containing protein [Rhodohalobacter sp. SW132]|uniref:DUF4342 domain-containing protein n=1 Tax=Rhodohalobacter sp. SW132 TaxID=2293433 RepID=UPI000E242C3D|nr:DUF4342 domain-containing protein [Rhodohalobacter sp. SW132]REL24154.1 DUF4342 domain-containing protein [Rhodohalobacter sp. SW132]
MTSSENTMYTEITGTIDEIIREVRKLIRAGNARSLIIKNKEGRILFQTQLTVGVAGTALFTAMAPIISAITMLIMFANDVQVIVEKVEDDSDPQDDEYEVDGEIIDIEDGDENEGEGEEKDKN